MTNPSEVTVTDKQLSDLAEALQIFDPAPGTEWHARYRQIVCEFIAKRVPDAPPQDNDDCGECAGVWHDGFNACRQRVLRGTP